MAWCPEPVRPPGCVHHLSLSALSLGSYGQLMVHWVSPNNLLTSMSTAGWMGGHLRAHTHTRMPMCAQARAEVSTVYKLSLPEKKETFQVKYEMKHKPTIKEQVIYEPISLIHFALGWTSSTHWRIVCMIYRIGLQPLSQASFN